jgi:hypothetical protein
MDVNMTFASKSRTAIAAAALIGVSAAPISATAAGPANNSCFLTSQWHGSSAPSDDTLLLRISSRDIFRVGVTRGADQLNAPGAYLVSKSRSSSVCTALDLDLYISLSGGISTPLIATSLTKLTPAEVAAIPKKDQP